jgi:hypothetical protein
MTAILLKVAAFAGILLLVACGSPKPRVPSLTPEEANALLHYNPKAETWLIHAKKQDPSCEYRLDLPDQTSQPTAIDLEHIVYCGNRPAGTELSASVSFAYDAATGKWSITRFSD